jgi:hypothetical protein
MESYIHGHKISEMNGWYKLILLKDRQLNFCAFPLDLLS